MRHRRQQRWSEAARSLGALTPRLRGGSCQPRQHVFGGIADHVLAEEREADGAAAVAGSGARSARDSASSGGDSANERLAARASGSATRRARAPAGGSGKEALELPAHSEGR